MIAAAAERGRGYAVVPPEAAIEGLPAPTAPTLAEPAPSDAGIDAAPRSVVDLIVADLAAIRRGETPKNKRHLVVASVLAFSVLVVALAALVSLVRSLSSKGPAPIASVAPSVSTSANMPPPPPVETKVATDDCSLAGDAKTLAPRIAIASAVEAQAIGDALAVGFAVSSRDAVALTLDPSSLAVTATVRARTAGGETRRVTPILSASKVSAIADVDRKGDRISLRRVAAATSTPIDLGIADGALVWAPHGKDTPMRLFALDGSGTVDALRATALSDGKGVALAFRQGNAIYAGVARGETELAPDGALSKIAGLGQVGSPTVAVSGEHVIVAWADRAAPTDDWKVRWTKLKAGATTENATTLSVPPGGPGGSAMSPSVAALGGGRFLLAWTEGAVSSRQIRAIAIDADGKPSAAALAISPAGTNAGQPAATVGSDGRGAVAYVAAKGKTSSVQAVPVRCAR